MAKPKSVLENLSRREKEFIKAKLGITKFEEADKTVLKLLKEALKKLKDSRSKNMIIYKLWDILMCVIIASLADCDDWDSIHDFVVDNYPWFKSFLQMTGGIPSAATYERVLSLIDSEELNNILFDFFTSLTLKETTTQKMNHIDGRVNNGSSRKSTLLNEEKRPLNCLNVYSTEYGYTIYTKQINEKSNEIPAVKDVIKGIDLTDIIVTWDALNTQIDNVNAVINSHGDYIVPIKGNQGTFYQDLLDYFDDECCEKIIAGNSKSAYLKQYEKSHSNFIVYEYYQTSDINWLENKNEWQGLATIGMVKKTITKQTIKTVEKIIKGKKKKEKKKVEETTVEKRYYISSRNININEFEKGIRGHWKVENKVHWHLDFTFKQDKNKTTNKKALLNLEIIHKFCLAILQKVKGNYNKSLRRIRKHLSNDIERFLPELVCLLLLH